MAGSPNPPSTLAGPQPSSPLSAGSPPSVAVAFTTSNLLTSIVLDLSSVLNDATTPSEPLSQICSDVNLQIVNLEPSNGSINYVLQGVLDHEGHDQSIIGFQCTLVLGAKYMLLEYFGDLRSHGDFRAICSGKEHHGRLPEKLHKGGIDHARPVQFLIITSTLCIDRACLMLSHDEDHQRKHRPRVVDALLGHSHRLFLGTHIDQSIDRACPVQFLINHIDSCIDRARSMLSLHVEKGKLIFW